MTEVHAVTTWFTRPGWTTAHELQLESVMNGIRSWVTLCGRDYPLDDPVVDDGPLQAPDDMRRCGQCLRRQP